MKKTCDTCLELRTCAIGARFKPACKDHITDPFALDRREYRMTMKRRGIVVLLNSLVGRFGFVLIERGELWRMDLDAENYAEVSKRKGIGKRAGGYFNGLSDYAGKKAAQLRARYTPNTPPHVKKAGAE